jgi:hypothetical protein
VDQVDQLVQAVQAAPLSETPEGPGVEEPLAMKPTATLAPGASVVAQFGAETVIVLPDWVKVPFQPLLMVTPLGTVKVTVHGLRADVPLFLTVTSPW